MRGELFFHYLNDMTYMSVPLRSLYFILPIFPLTPEETQAIMYHDGQYVDDNKSVATKECPLLFFTVCGYLEYVCFGERKIIMGKNDDDFDDFLMFKTITGGGGCGGCLISALSFIGIISFIILLVI